MSIESLIALLAWFISVGDTANAASTQQELDRAKGPICG